MARQTRTAVRAVGPPSRSRWSIVAGATLLRLGVERRQRGLGGVVTGNRGERARVVGEGQPDRGTEHGIGERPGVEQLIGGEELGHTKGGDERDVGDAAGPDDARTQQASGREAGEVGRYDDGDRGEGGTRFGAGHRGRERLARRPPVSHDLHPLDHPAHTTSDL